MDAFPHQLQTPLELDYLVNTLRSPNPSLTVQNVLGYLYNYLPYVKHEHNLRIVLASFLNNPVCFGAELPSFVDNYLIIEVFKLITEKKLKVSQPTLPVKAFYRVLEKELHNFALFDPLKNSWKVLPIIAGISLANTCRDQLLPSFIEHRWFFSDFDSSMRSLFAKSFQTSMLGTAHIDIVNLSLISLALIYKPSGTLQDYLGLADSKLVIRKLTNLLYGPSGGAQIYGFFAHCSPNDKNIEQLLTRNVLQHPTVKHLNRLSFLLEKLFQDLDYSPESHDLVCESVALILVFDRKINYFTESQEFFNKGTQNLKDGDMFAQQYWFLMKSILFSQVLIFQGMISRFLSLKKRGLLSQFFSSKKHSSRFECQYREICSTMLHCLYYLNFILMAIGQGGFDGYNFIYYVALEIVLQNNSPKRFEYFSRLLIGNYEVNLHPQTLNCSYVARCKVLFVLGLWENYLQQSHVKDKEFLEYLYATTFDIVKDPYLQDDDLCEAGHSVMLSYFSGMENSRENMQKVLQYFELLIGQFPQRLSAYQLSVAVETLGKKIMAHSMSYDNSLYKNTIDEFLSFVYNKCFDTVPGQSIENPKVVLFNSAQPISEIEASSTMSQLKDDSGTTNIIDDNKGEKPRDAAYIDVFSTARNDPTENFGIRETPNTSREGIIMAFMNVVPYLPMSVFIHWLNKIWRLIMSSNKEEQNFLIGKLWKCLSENLDLNRCEIAYKWWYETLRAAELNLGHQPALFKL
ncbi:hypothetical protein METBIDRAFT_48046 [Metschnikowia bicuspidata var. bicuspidata NRRL YB-4993]|uniref:Uncharacterized protein n=1 Tax=Metschnikowia bicuspidata var. bicuspidata NRRL YB-4993 TaxID=869754 RepID=A0A1A0GZ44_9ASCO|nr:hypothetical protein METBIDRAFT_48046 [Metschnikowia bicuspidata var. bicuspidata NRRL YB-4993]OBA16998.1 hypothetical protein METBIDRAFT_48046 [Metschnikowia bicuspidata var. bicuspidata NRRL YB-4993]